MIMYFPPVHLIIEDFLDTAFRAVELDWRAFVKQDDRYRRPAEVSRLVGDPTKACKNDSAGKQTIR